MQKTGRQEGVKPKFLNIYSLNKKNVTVNSQWVVKLISLANSVLRIQALSLASEKVIKGFTLFECAFSNKNERVQIFSKFIDVFMVRNQDRE
jgi:hypothetical protein